MKSTLFTWQEVRDKADFAIKKYKNKSTYKGQVDLTSNKRSGCGVVLYPDGRLYEGEWLNDKRTGHGYEVFRNGSIYTG